VSQAFSTFALEALLHSGVMGYPSVFTDHSLFGFADASSIHMNKLLKVVFSNVSHVICVSNTRCTTPFLSFLLFSFHFLSFSFHAN
jgi:hypothetical protein